MVADDVRDRSALPAGVRAALEGYAASGLGLLAWALAGDVGGMAGSVVAGSICGLMVERPRDLVPACLAAVASILLIDLVAFPPTPHLNDALLRYVLLLVIALDAWLFLVGGGFGLVIARRRSLGPIRSAVAVNLVAFAAMASLVAWLWFAMNIGAGT